MIAKGCDALGYSHGPLRRNAPDCDGQGFCAYGCPTDAKRSTNISYVPMALNQGAFLYTGARVEEVLVEDGRAVGVVARAKREDGSTAQLIVRARAVILACGTLLTPMLLMKNGLLKNSPALGRNLVIHPAMQMLAKFDEEIRGWNGIPQGYAIEEFHRAGILFEGAFTPLEIASLGMPFHGPKFMDLMESFNNLATFGFFVADRGGGRIRPGPMGRPIVHYNLHKEDIARFKLGASVLWRVFKEAGASEIYTNIRGHEDMMSQEAHDRMMRSKIRGRDLELTAFHPLGTARLGSDPETSVVDERHESHELPGLYIVDGASVPGSPSVNPQVTIMALALRAAEQIAEQLN
jgi:choline dehydrogenase-like flavoprotein